MNTLGRDIQEGEVVVLKANIFRSKRSVKARMFRCDSGFGMSDRTSGTALYGCLIDDPMLGDYHHEDKIRVEGYMVDAEITLNQQKKNGVTILPRPVDPDQKYFGKGGHGYIDLWDRYTVNAWEQDNGEYIVTAHLKGVFDFLPRTAPDRLSAEVIMKNHTLVMFDKPVMDEEEELIFRMHKRAEIEKDRIFA
jgi:hypothetical protein